ncbi:MAG TPA: mersacidin/lichenicidin family type 2 lantibiotic [Herpetosiphonaceae bacterium]
MSAINVIRAWKDEDYRMSLSEEQLGLLPASPVGTIDLSDEDLDAIGAPYTTMSTAPMGDL